MSDCRHQVEAAIRRHRALAGVHFPYGDCGQPDCPHDLVRELVAYCSHCGGEVPAGTGRACPDCYGTVKLRHLDTACRHAPANCPHKVGTPDEAASLWPQCGNKRNMARARAHGPGVEWVERVCGLPAEHQGPHRMWLDHMLFSWTEPEPPAAIADKYRCGVCGGLDFDDDGNPTECPGPPREEP